MPSQKKTLLDKWKWLEGVMSDPRLSGTAKSVAYFMVDYRRDETGLAYPSCETLGRRAGVCERSAQEAVRKLRERGWVILVQRNHGPGQSNRYAINWENTIEPSQIRQHKKKPSKKENTNSSAQNANEPSAFNTNEPSDNSSYSFTLKNPLKKEAACKTDPGHESHDPAGLKSTEVFKPTKIEQTIFRQMEPVEAYISEADNNFAPPQQSQRQQHQEALEKLKQWEFFKAEAKRYGVEVSEYCRFQKAHDKAAEVATPMMLYRISEEARCEHNDPPDQIRFMTKRYEAILITSSSKNDRNECNDETDQGAGEKKSKPTLPSKPKG